MQTGAIWLLIQGFGARLCKSDTSFSFRLQGLQMCMLKHLEFPCKLRFRRLAVYQGSLQLRSCSATCWAPATPSPWSSRMTSAASAGSVKDTKSSPDAVLVPFLRKAPTSSSQSLEHRRALAFCHIPGGRFGTAGRAFLTVLECALGGAEWGPQLMDKMLFHQAPLLPKVLLC